MTSVRKWLRVLAAVTVCVSLVYPVIDAMDWTGITDLDTDFKVLAFLLIVGMLAVLLRLFMLAVQMVIRIRGGDLMSERLNMQCCRHTVCVVRPPGQVPVPLRI